MNTLKILLLLQILNVLLIAQNITSVEEFFKANNIQLNAVQDSSTIDPYSFFPTHVGDFWQYNTAGDFIRSKTVTKDSLLPDSSRLIYYNNDEQWPTYRIDTNYSVFFHPFHLRGNNLWYKLDADIGERWWIERDSANGELVQGYIGEIDTVYEGFYLGKNSRFKVISKYLIYNNNGVIQEFWDSDKVLASGIGLIYEDKDGVPPDRLIAAIIDGDTLGTIVGVDDKTNSSLPNTIGLKQNYPNPFNPSTKIKFQLPRASRTKLVVYNVLGDKIKTLVDKNLDRGNYSKIWNGKNDNGIEVPSGIYFYKLQAGKFTKVRKMLLMK